MRFLDWANRLDARFAKWTGSGHSRRSARLQLLGATGMVIGGFLNGIVALWTDKGAQMVLAVAVLGLGIYVFVQTPKLPPKDSRPSTTCAP